MKRSVIVLLHSGYWFLYLCLLVLILMCLNVGTQLQNDALFFSFRFGLFFLGFAVIPAVVGFYTFYSFLFNRFLTRKKIPLLFLAGIGAAILCGLLGVFNLFILGSLKIGPGVGADGWVAVVSITLFIAVIAVLNGGMGLLLRGFIRWYDELKLKEDLALKNFETELALIKARLDPHFLFNTINNIDVLINRDPARASAYLQKLSDIMRYMLYETRSAQIPLRDEWTYIEKFIELQKIRTFVSNYAGYACSGNLDEIRIAPMILIPFVENAFKHAERVKSENAIRIHLHADAQQLVFECENKFLPAAALPAEYGGLGNDLIEKRLQLLYPGRHRLSVHKNNDLYSVHLVIQTA
jgi:two-component system, LytTR family, sensor kinase